MRDRVRRVCRERLKASETEAEAEAGWRCCASWKRRGSARSIPFAARCCGRTPSRRRLDPRFQISAAGAGGDAVFGAGRRPAAASNWPHASEALIDLGVMFSLKSLARHDSAIEPGSGRLRSLGEMCGRKSSSTRWQAFEREQVVPQLVQEFLQLPEVKQMQAILATARPTHETMQQRFAAMAHLLPRLSEERDPPSKTCNRSGNSPVCKGAEPPSTGRTTTTTPVSRTPPTSVRGWIDANTKHLAFGDRGAGQRQGGPGDPPRRPRR